MTIDEAIKHAEKAANANERLCETVPPAMQLFDYGKCVKENRQLAEWLKELKHLKEQTKWVLASERPPEEKGDYLVILRSGWMHFREVCYFDGNTWDKGGYDEVVKWQYLPNIEEGEE